MKIGIIVYSQTGNTYSVATKLYDQLKKDYKVEMERIEVNRDMKKDPNIFDFVKKPSVEGYDAIVFASPVEGFSLCPVMKKYLEDIVSLKGKRVTYFVTEFFPYPWMGGNRAIKQMKNICNSKGAISLSSSVVNWKNKYREELIKEVIKNATSDFKNIK